MVELRNILGYARYPFHMLLNYPIGIQALYVITMLGVLSMDFEVASVSFRPMILERGSECLSL